MDSVSSLNTMYYLLTTFCINPNEHKKYFMLFSTGCIFYVIMYFALKMVTTDELFEQYKVYLAFIIIIDVAYLFYYIYSRSKVNYETRIEIQKIKLDEIKPDKKKKSSDQKDSTEMIDLISITEHESSSEHSIKISHDTHTEHDVIASIFASPEEINNGKTKK